ncbi:MAG TPA: peptide ABC transporter substrate-binding protein [Firmicutes bacterium]|nr:peptide ABC transporter substrate-binding protein [Bacillota bacterium]
MSVNSDTRLLNVTDLVKYYPIKRGFLRKTVGHVKAVDGVSFYVNEGEALGLVGESGCGKTSTGRCILRAIEPSAGEILFRDKDAGWVNVRELPEAELHRVRQHMQIIFQDPYGSLNPRMTVGDIIGEPLHIHKLARGAEREKRVRELLEVVGLSAFHARRFPHEFSGGQRQRIGIARALAVRPRLIICDEPVSALDVSIQAQVINLLQDLQREFDLTYIFIAHDLAVVKHISDRVAVMYLGKIVELTDKNELYRNPKHPYTQALLSAIPEADPTIKKERILLKGDVPSPINPPKGCRFHTRCPKVMDICKVEEPEFVDSGNGHFVACHLVPAAEEKGA